MQLSRAWQPGLLGWAKAAAQAIAEIRALAGWLLGEGCPAVALWGTSYGGWLAGLTACGDQRLAPIVLTAPGARTNLSMAKLILRRGVREAMQRQRKAYEELNLTPWNLTSARPAVPKENILLIEGLHDLICPKAATECVWQTWEKPDIWRFPHGHVGVCCGGVPGLTGHVLRWLSARLNAPAIRTAKSSG